MPLISEDYRKQQAELHEEGHYGGMGEGAYADIVADIINRMEPTHVLDYGCGSRLSLAHGLRGKVNKDRRFKYQAYDPCVERFSAPPVPAEMVVCLDVLEHIEEDSIDEVLDHLEALTEAVGFFSVDTAPAKKTLPDGRNAHVLQRPPEWWLPRFMARFDLQTYQVTHQGEEPEWKKFYVVVHSKRGLIELD